MEQHRFYNFIKKNDTALVNGKYVETTKNIKEAIDNIVINLEEVYIDKWKITLEEEILDNSNILYIEKIK